MAASIKCGERPFKGGVWGGFGPPAKIEKKSKIVKKFNPGSRFLFLKFLNKDLHCMGMGSFVTKATAEMSCWTKKKKEEESGETPKEIGLRIQDDSDCGLHRGFITSRAYGADRC